VFPYGSTSSILFNILCLFRLTIKHLVVLPLTPPNSYFGTRKAPPTALYLPFPFVSAPGRCTTLNQLQPAYRKCAQMRAFLSFDLLVLLKMCLELIIITNSCGLNKIDRKWQICRRPWEKGWKREGRTWAGTYGEHAWE